MLNHQNILTNEQVIIIAKELGFDLIGFAKAEPLLKEMTAYEKWIANGYQAGMKYLENNYEKRLDVRNILPSAKSVISLGLNYYIRQNQVPGDDWAKVSRYAWGKDYHDVIWDKLKILSHRLKEIESDIEIMSYVDTGPVLDKVWAVKSGLGWMGKNTNIINKNIGSWYFIASVFINKEFKYSEPVGDFCGTCTKCIDECPTKAIIDGYIIDSNKCISYLTIESKNEIPNEFAGKMAGYIFGCDICQDVCPWNKKRATEGNEKAFYPYNGNDRILKTEIEKMEAEEFRKRFKGSAIKRAKLSGLKKNLRALESFKDKKYLNN